MNASVLSDVAIKGSVKAETPILGRPQGAPDPGYLDEALDAEGPSGEAIPSAEAIRAAKRLIAYAESGANAAEVLLRESEEQAALIGKPEQMEVVMANMQKRPPVFK